MRRRRNLGDLSGGGAIAAVVYGPEIGKLQKIATAPYPRIIGPAPPDELIFSDSDAYLRYALNNGHWDSVARWYATTIQMILNRTTYASDFYALSQLDLQSKCDRYLNLGDLRALTEKCMYILMVNDLGAKVGFGTDKRLPSPPFKAPGFYSNEGIFYASLVYGNQQTGYFKCYDAVKDLPDSVGVGRGLVSVEGPPPIVDTYTVPTAIPPPPPPPPPVYVPPPPPPPPPIYVPPPPVTSYRPPSGGRAYTTRQLEGLGDVPGPRNYVFCLGWVKEPNKHTVGRIMVAVGAAFIGAAAFTAISAGVGAASGGVTGGATGAGAGSAAGAATGGAAGATAGGAIGAGVVAAPVIETVVVTAAAPIITAAGAAAGIAAGGLIAAAAAPPPISAPQISAPQPAPQSVPVPETTPIIETVVTTATPIAPIPIAPIIAAPIAAAAVLPVIPTEPLPIVQGNPPVAEQPIETVTVEATQVAAPTVTQVTATAVVATQVAPPVIEAAPIETVTVEASRPVETPVDPVAATVAAALEIPALEAPTIEAPEAPEIEDSLKDKIKEKLKDLLEELGERLLKDLLEKLLQQLLGRPPTQQEIEEYTEYIDEESQRRGGVRGRVAFPGFTASNFLLVAAIIVAVRLLTDRKGPTNER